MYERSERKTNNIDEHVREIKTEKEKEKGCTVIG
jgi:hypothetical protein